MIALVTDILEPWFIYIWEQFARVNKLESEYGFFTYDQFKQIHEHTKRSLILEYSSYRKVSQSLFIPRRNRFKTDDYVWIQNELPVYSGTFDKKLNNFDIFFNAFVHLSRLEEWISEKKGKRIYSYAFRHPRKVQRIWKIPVVNHLFNLLETEIRKTGHNISFGGQEKPIIQFSHDVDYLRKTVQLRIKQSGYSFLNSAKLFFNHDRKKALSVLKRGVVSATGNADYRFFEWWNDLEDKLDIRSVYYFYARRNKLPTRMKAVQWMLDPSYDISGDKDLKNICRGLVGRGHEIGLHASYLSAVDDALYVSEKNKLERIVNRPVTKSRQHWLNYLETVTPYTHQQAGIKTDSSLGFNDIEGFRSGIASIYNPYDHKMQKAFSFDEIPLVLMDAHIEDHSNCLDRFNWLFECFGTSKKLLVSVDWHQRGASPEYGWINSFEKLCREYKKTVTC
jgi:hypothetical protein